MPKSCVIAHLKFLSHLSCQRQSSLKADEFGLLEAGDLL